MTEIENRLRYYLGKLEEPHRTQALSQIDLYFSKHLSDCKLIDNRHNAINWAFCWKNSKQGHNYWSEFKESLPNTPEPYEPETEVKPKKVKLIEFDYEKYKAGAKAVYRNGEVPQMVIMPEIHNKIYPFISVLENGDCTTNSIFGKYNIDIDIHQHDLLLEVEEESEPELFVNVIEEYMRAISLVYKDFQSASNGKLPIETTYKLVKVNQ